MELRRFVVRFALYCLLFWALNMLLGYYLSSFETGILTRQGAFFSALRWEEYYQREEPIDVLILGSSHAFRSYDPAVMEPLMGDDIRIFNFGSAAQSPATSYYILKEVADNHPVRLLIFDLYYMVFTSDEQLKSGLINLKYMRGGEAKLDFFLDAFSWQEKAATLLLPSYVYRQYCKPAIKQLLGLQYLPRKRGEYQGSGFVSFPDTVSLEALHSGNQFDHFTTHLEDLTANNEAYLERIAEACRSRNIKLVFTVAPMPEISVRKIKNYREISDHFRRLADKWQVPYLDFNIDRLPQISDETHFYDDDHLNTSGARIYSAEIARVNNYLCLFLD